MATHQHMVYNYLGNSGLKVSNICLGTMSFGRGEGMRPGQADEGLSHRIMDKYVELGGNFFDTANIYPIPVTGVSESILGTWLQKHQNRDRYVVATKVYGCMDNSDVNARGLSRKSILSGIEGSLRRLGTDYVDLYQIHCWDDGTPVEETLRTLDDLVRAGKVRYVGVSNVLGWQLQKLVDTCKHLGLSSVVSLQAQYSLMCRETEWELLDVCQREGLAMLPWSPLKGGWLTGKIKRDKAPGAGDCRVGWAEGDKTRVSQSHPSYTELADDEKTWQLLGEMEKIASAHSKSVTQVALRWLLQKASVASVVVGVRTLGQLEDNMGAFGGWWLSEEEMLSLDALSQPKIPYPYEMVWRMAKDRKRQ